MKPLTQAEIERIKGHGAEWVTKEDLARLIADLDRARELLLEAHLVTGVASVGRMAEVNIEIETYLREAGVIE